MTTRIKTTPKTQLYNMNEVIYNKKIKNLHENNEKLFNELLMNNFTTRVTDFGNFTAMGDNVLEIYEILKLIQQKFITVSMLEINQNFRYEVRGNIRVYDFGNISIIVNVLGKEQRKLADYIVEIENIQIKFKPKKYMEFYNYYLNGYSKENEFLDGFHFVSEPIQKVVWSKK